MPEDDLESAEAERIDGVRDGEGIVGHHAGHGRRHLNLRSHKQVVRILLCIDLSCLGEFVDFQVTFPILFLLDHSFLHKQIGHIYGEANLYLHFSPLILSGVSYIVNSIFLDNSQNPRPYNQIGQQIFPYIAVNVASLVEPQDAAVALAAEAVRGQRARGAFHAQFAHGGRGRRVAHLGSTGCRNTTLLR